MGALNNCWAGNFVQANNEYVDCGSHAAFNFIPKLNVFSLHAWVKGSFLANGDHTVLMRGTTATKQYGFGINGTTLNIYVGNTLFAHAVLSEVGINLADNNWHQLVVSVTTSQINTHVDGQKLFVDNLVGTAIAPVNLLIGAHRNLDNTDATAALNGIIDEVGIWSTILSDTAAVALWSNGNGLMLDSDSGSYVNSLSLEGWWRLGDGSTENAGGVPTSLINDESGNGRSGTINSTALDLAIFYWGGGGLKVVPGIITCEFFISSSSTTAITGPSFTFTRRDQGNLRGTVGFEGDIHRLVITITASVNVDNKLLVVEYGRPFPGTAVRREVFRRVASLRDLTLVPADTPGSVFPFAFRTNQVSVYGASQVILDKVWLEIQRQAAILSLDMQEFGVPQIQQGVNKIPIFVGGGGSADMTASETFGAVVPPPTVIKLLSSSSFVAPLIKQLSSSSMFIPASSSIVQLSSSSLYVDPHLFNNVSFKIADAAKDVAMRSDDTAIKTLYTGMGFVRMGRDVDPTHTWDSFFRFKLGIPRCSTIIAASFILAAKSSELGEDVVLRLHEIYDDSLQQTISPFTGIADPFSSQFISWTHLLGATAGGVALPRFTISPIPDVTAFIQHFVDRGNYDPANDYFGLWIQEIISDVGARRDASVVAAQTPKIIITYRDDGQCALSSSSLVI